MQTALQRFWKNNLTMELGRLWEHQSEIQAATKAKQSKTNQYFP